MNKIKEWIKKTGLTNIAYLGIAVGAKVLLGSNLLTGAALGIFIYLNYNVIQKLIKDVVKKEK